MAGSSRSYLYVPWIPWIQGTMPVPVYILVPFADLNLPVPSTGTVPWIYDIQGTQGFRGLFVYKLIRFKILGTTVLSVIRLNIDIHADLSWLLCMICHTLILRLWIRVNNWLVCKLNAQIACMKIARLEPINHFQQSALASPGLDFCPPSTTLVFIGSIM